MNILIVDDEELAVQGILDGVNWEQLSFDKVLTARSYEDAVSIFGNTYIDILVSDIEMPGESGLKLIEYVNAHSPMRVAAIAAAAMPAQVFFVFSFISEPPLSVQYGIAAQAQERPQQPEQGRLKRFMRLI